MEANPDYWFAKYDSESFEKDFQKVLFMEYLNQLVAHPDFKSLPNQPTKSKDKGFRIIQDCLLQFSEVTTDFFLQTRELQRESFYRWVRQVLAFMDVEKLYSIMFWNLNFIPNFIEGRLYATLIRVYKFLISFIQNLSPQSRDLANRQSIVKQRPTELLYLPINYLIDYQRGMLKIFKPLVSSTPTLLSKIYYFIYHMYDKPLATLKKDLDLQFSLIEVNWVKKILNENQFAMKYIDAYLDDSEQYRKKFDWEDSEVLNSMTQQYFRIEPNEKDLLEKSKKQQFLDQLDKKGRKEKDKCSPFVANYKDMSSQSGQSEDESKKRKFRSSPFYEDDLRTQASSSMGSNLDPDLFRHHTFAPAAIKPSQLSFEFQQKPKVIKTELTLDDDLVDFISKADSKVAEIRDEDIIFDNEQNRKRKYRLKKKKNIDENDSPDPARKQTAANLQSIENQTANEEEQRRLLARRLMEEQNQAYFEKLRQLNIQESEGGGVKDTELFRYSFEDSLEEDEGESDNELKHEKVPIPKNYSQNSQAVVFERFRALAGQIKSITQIRKNNIIKKLYYCDQNSRSISMKTLLTDYDQEERRLKLYIEAIRSSILPKKDKVSSEVNEIVEQQVGQQYICERRLMRKNNKNYLLY